MIGINRKRALLAAAVFLGTSFAGPAAAQHSESQALYDNYFYDASDELLLYSQDSCTFQGVVRPSTPAGTAYVTQFIWAYCVNGQLVGA